jgi:PTH1 family peptidyl-tRNA hydrolase
MSERAGAREWLLFGLGNPGGRYERSRHNLGWLLLDLLVARHDLRYSAGRGDYFFARYELESARIHLIKPTTYMNLSGRAVRQYLAIERPENAELMVAIDDVHLPLGRIRFRPGGSAGGHNGLASVIEILGRDDFPRLRMGVGPGPAGEDLAEYVLEDFAEEEWEPVTTLLERAADAFESWVREGSERTMSRFNG